MDNKLSFVEKVADFGGKVVAYEPVLISDLLAFISSIILLIITWKSVSNAKKSNEITLDSLKISEETLRLQRQQFNENIKPVLVMYFPEVMTEKKSLFNENWVSENVSMLFGDYRFKVKNTSENIAYNVRTYVYLYAENEKWIEHKNNGHKDIPLIFTTNGSFHLDSNEKIKNTIPYHYFNNDMENFYNEIYILVYYENKIGDVYQEGYVLRQSRSVFGKSHITINFESRSMDIVKLKEIVLNQKEFLKEHFENELSYYFVPK